MSIVNPTNLPSRTFGLLLSKEIWQYVKDHKIITPHQCAAKFYSDRKQCERLAQKKLLKMHRQKSQVRKLRRIPTEQGYFVYHIERINEWEHIEAINWAYIWLESQLKPGETIDHWEYEKDYGFIRPDALIGIKSADNQLRYMFIEADRAEWRNEFDKVPKYCQLYEEKGKPKDFPAIMVVTTRLARVDVIKEKVSGSEYPLKWMVKYLPDLVKEVNPCQ